MPRVQAKFASYSVHSHRHNHTDTHARTHIENSSASRAHLISFVRGEVSWLIVLLLESALGCGCIGSIVRLVVPLPKFIRRNLSYSLNVINILSVSGPFCDGAPITPQLAVIPLTTCNGFRVNVMLNAATIYNSVTQFLQNAHVPTKCCAEQCPNWWRCSENPRT